MKIKVDIISGFLGAGKTKLIKKLVDESFYDQKVVVIENDFGEIGIDGSFLNKYDVEVEEINAGCICCSILNDFKNTLEKIINSKQVERIIIEPSGVGKLSEIIKIVKELGSKNNILLNMIITVIDVTMYEDFIDFFSEFYKDQIIYANTIVLSRTQNIEYENLQNIITKIKQFNKKASIVTTPWDNLKGESIIEASEKDTRKSLFEKPNVVKMPSSKMKFKIKRKISAEDIFESFGIETPKIFSVETLKSIFENLKDENLYGKILRAKGILQTDKDHWIEFDFAAKKFEIRDTRPDYTGRICVIGVNLNKENLANLF